MSDMLGIINFESPAVHIAGLSQFRPIPSISFLGRYRLIDFVLSNMSNSGISNIFVHVKENPHSVFEHVGTGRHYNINSKRGSLEVYNPDPSLISAAYNSDVHSFLLNSKDIEVSPEEYVCIAPSYFVYTTDFNALLDDHLASGADVSLLYRSIDDARETCVGCTTLQLERSSFEGTDIRRVRQFSVNRGKYKSRNVSLECYVMRKDLFLNLVHRADQTSSFYWLQDILSDLRDELFINAVALKPKIICINSLQAYYHAHMLLTNYERSREMFKADWPIYTRTSDSPPARYTTEAKVRQSVIANGCLIMGTVENSVIGRNVVIEEGAVVENSIILTKSHIASGVHLDHVVVDKHVEVFNAKEIVGLDDNDVIYISRGDKV